MVLVLAIIALVLSVVYLVMNRASTPAWLIGVAVFLLSAIHVAVGIGPGF